MNIKLCGTEIWLGDTLMSEGLTGPAYAAKLREVEHMKTQLAHIPRSALLAEYNRGRMDGFHTGYQKGKEDGIQQQSFEMTD